MVVDFLSLMMNKAVDTDVFDRVCVGSNRVKISHLQFADDTIFFREASSKNILVLKCILHTFELWSGLKINYNKNMLSGINIDDVVMSEWTSSLNCKKAEFPLKYLVLKIGANHGRVAS